MAVSSTSIFDVRVGGSDTANGGAFDPLNTSMATDLTATAANTAAAVVSSASYTFLARDVGAWLFVKAGTNWTAGWYQIASISGSSAVLSAAAGAGYLAGTSAIPASPGVTTAAGCATVASPAGGTWTIDYSQAMSPGIVYTDMVIDGTTNTKYTSALNPVGPNVVGNTIAVTSGTGFTVAVRQVSSVTGTTATCDASLGTLASTGGNGGLGGCLATPGRAMQLGASPGQTTFIKANGGSPDYTFSNSGNVAGGRLSVNQTFVLGWNTVRTVTSTDSTRPTFIPGANSVVMIYPNVNAIYYRNLNFTTPGHTSCQAIQIDASNVHIERCRWDGYTNTIYVTSGSASYYSCEIKNSSQGVSISGSVYVISNCTVNGGGNNAATALQANIMADNIVYAFAGPAFSLINNNELNAVLRNIAYGCTGVAGTGFSGAPVFFGLCENNVAWGNAIYGYDLGNGSATMVGKLRGCAAGSNGTANFRSPLATWSAEGAAITLTADPFTNASGLDFSLNSTAGGGALLRGLGFPSSWPGFSTNSYIDSGAAQHQAAGSGPTFFAR